jgi:hypothetical protein
MLHPFKITLGKNELKKHSKFELKASCPSTIANFVKEKNTRKLCEGEIASGSAKQINRILSKLKLKLNAPMANEFEAIIYWVRSTQKPRKVKTFIQNLQPQTELPVQILKETIIYDLSLSYKVLEHVVQIDEEYLRGRNRLHFAVIAEDSSMPQWIKFKVVHGDLILFGQPTPQQARDYSLTFTLEDNATELTSKPITINIKFIGLTKKEITMIFGGILLLFSASLIILCVAIFCSSPEKNGISPVDQSSDNLEPQDSKLKIVLSESITNWANATQRKKMKPKFTRRSPGAQELTTVNDSLNELEILQHNFSPQSNIDLKANDKNPASDDSIGNIDAFHNISNICELNELRLEAVASGDNSHNEKSEPDN